MSRSSKVYIGDLPQDASEREIEDALSYYGPLRSVWVARRPPGFAFVEYEDPRDADDAVRGLDGRTVCGSRVRVELSRGGGRGGGRGGFGRGGGGGGGRFDDRECRNCGRVGHIARECLSGRSAAARRRDFSRSRSRSRSPRRSPSRSRSRSRASRSRSGSAKRARS